VKPHQRYAGFSQDFYGSRSFSIVDKLARTSEIGVGEQLVALDGLLVKLKHGGVSGAGCTVT